MPDPTDNLDTGDALARLRLWLAAQPPTAVVFPARIGCGLAGGRWDEYRACIEEFAAALDPALHPVVVVEMARA